MNDSYRATGFSLPTLHRVGALLFCMLAGDILLPSAASGQYVDWVRQLGTTGVDGYWGVSVDSTSGSRVRSGRHGGPFSPRKQAWETPLWRHTIPPAIFWAECKTARLPPIA